MLNYLVGDNAGVAFGGMNDVGCDVKHLKLKLLWVGDVLVLVLKWLS